MALFVVERDVSTVAPERLRVDQRELAAACLLLKSRGRQIRYINSAVIPADARCLDLFGGETAEVVAEAHVIAGVSYLRVVEVLDLTPRFVDPETTRPKTLHRGSRPIAADVPSAKRSDSIMAENSAPELTRWLTEGQRFFRLCAEMLEDADQLRARNQTLQRENEIFREEIARLRHKAEVLEADRSEMVAAFNDLAGHVTQVVDHILQKSEDGENSSAK